MVKIYDKLKCVLIPRTNVDNSKQLRDWDLWGPLIICILLSCIIGYGSDSDKGLIFVIVFFVIWIGGLVITLNAQFLGSKVTILQSICLLGYCVFPFVVFGFIIKITPFFNDLVHVLLSAVAFVWASYCKL